MSTVFFEFFWTRPFGREGSEGSEGSKGSEGKVDGASPRGFLRFLSLTAFQAEGCGIALRAMSIKSALRVHLSVSYGMIGIRRIGSLRSPPPIRLRRTSPRESVSHDSQVALLPYESCFLATPVQGEE